MTFSLPVTMVEGVPAHHKHTHVSVPGDLGERTVTRVSTYYFNSIFTNVFVCQGKYFLEFSSYDSCPNQAKLIGQIPDRLGRFHSCRMCTRQLKR